MSLTKLLPANRLVAITTILTALAGFIAGIAGVFPDAWQNTTLVAVALLTKLVTAIKFMDGSQKFDALKSNEAVASPTYTVSIPRPSDVIARRIAADFTQATSAQDPPQTETHVDVGNEPLFTKDEVADSQVAALQNEVPTRLPDAAANVPADISDSVELQQPHLPAPDATAMI